MGLFTKVQDQVRFFPFRVCVYKALALCCFLPVALLAKVEDESPLPGLGSQQNGEVKVS